jgi:ATP-dependent Clp protease adaptor protein ClpS
MPKIKELKEEEVLLAEDLGEEHDLIVWNDDVNTFDHVIKTLREVCKHTRMQAEQCTMIIHNNGKCGVKRGSFDYLKPMAEAIIDRGINATIE